MKQDKIFTHQTLEEYNSDKRVVITPPPRNSPTHRFVASIHAPYGNTSKNEPANHVMTVALINQNV